MTYRFFRSLVNTFWIIATCVTFVLVFSLMQEGPRGGPLSQYATELWWLALFMWGVLPFGRLINFIRQVKELTTGQCLGFTAYLLTVGVTVVLAYIEMLAHS